MSGTPGVASGGVVSAGGSESAGSSGNGGNGGNAGHGGNAGNAGCDVVNVRAEPKPNSTHLPPDTSVGVSWQCASGSMGRADDFELSLSTGAGAVDGKSHRGAGPLSLDFVSA
ncbi:MAG TPA: hypothetical protein VNG33_22330, partial [Polyangiaceae bacterium]|nr:hypothetical protein [Polyangiaceae bacterium]